MKKAVSWALRAVGRRNAVLKARAVAMAQRLSASTDPTSRWIGKDALQELTRAPRARPEVGGKLPGRAR